VCIGLLNEGTLLYDNDLPVTQRSCRDADGMNPDRFDFATPEGRSVITRSIAGV
jgi:hypothetical protein